LSNVAGDFIDHPPISYVGRKEILSAFMQEENHVHFTIADYDKTKRLIIDPRVDPVFPGVGDSRKALEISYDNCVIVISGEVVEFLVRIIYYDNSGVLIWEWVHFYTVVLQ
jgi:hypothetical protein